VNIKTGGKAEVRVVGGGEFGQFSWEQALPGQHHHHQ